MNKPYKIEKSIKRPPIAHNNGSRKSRICLTMELLKVNESFLVRDPLEAVRAAKLMRTFNSREARRNGKRRFTSRLSHMGVRIWRVA